MARNSPADIARRRQAIYLGLVANLSEAQAQLGLRLWDTGYAQDRSSAIIDFVAELSAQLDLPPKQRHEVRMGLYQGLLKYDAGRNAADMPAAPASMPPSGSLPTPTAGASSGDGAPMFTVFSMVAQSILGGVRADGLVAMHDFVGSLQAQQDSSGLKPDDLSSLIAWVKESGSLSAFARAREDLLARLIHVLYVATAEALGPVAADRLLAQSVSTAELSPEARKFPAKRFL